MSTNLEIGIGLKQSDFKQSEAYFRGIGMSADEAAAEVKKLQESAEKAGSKISATFIKAAADAGRLDKAVEAGGANSAKAAAKAQLSIEKLRAEIEATRKTGGPVDPRAIAALDQLQKSVDVNIRKAAELRNSQNDVADAMRAAQARTDLQRGSINDLGDIIERTGPQWAKLVGGASAAAGAFTAGYAAGTKLLELLNELTDGGFGAKLQGFFDTVLAGMPDWAQEIAGVKGAWGDENKMVQEGINLQKILKAQGIDPTNKSLAEMRDALHGIAAAHFESAEAAKKHADEAKKAHDEALKAAKAHLAALDQMKERALKLLGAADPKGTIFDRKLMSDQAKTFADIATALQKPLKAWVAGMHDTAAATAENDAAFDEWNAKVEEMRQEWLLLQQDLNVSYLADGFSMLSDALGGTGTQAGRVAQDMGHLVTALYDVTQAKTKMDKAMATAVAIQGLGGLFKDLNIGASNKTGGTSALGGRLEGNYAGIGSTIGMVIGAAIAAYFTAGAATGAGAAIGTAIGGLIGGLISKAGDSASASLMTGGGVKIGETAEKLNGAVSDALHNIFAGLNAELGSLGLQLTEMPLIDIKVRDNIIRVIVGNVLRTFSTMQDAVSFGIAEAVKQAATLGGHLPPEVLAALKNSQAKDIQSLQSDIAFAQSIANFGVPKVVQAIDKAVSDFFVAMQRANSLGIDTAKVAEQFVAQIQQQKDAILGVNRNLSPADQMKSDAAAFNQKVQLLRAQEQMDIAEMQQRRVELQGKVAILRAEAALNKEHMELTRDKLEVDSLADQAARESLNAMVAALAATDVAIASAQAIIAGLSEISDKELQEALKHVGRGGGGGVNPLETLKDMLRDLALQALGPLARQIADINQKWDDEIKLLGKNKAAIEDANEARRKEINLALKEAKKTADDNLNTFMDPGLVSQIRKTKEQSAALVKEQQDLQKASKGSKDALHEVVKAIREHSRELQAQALQGAANSILLGLYEYLGMDKEAAELKHDLAVAELVAKEAELEAALAIATIDAGARDKIQHAIDIINGLIPRVANDPNFGVGGPGGGGGGGTATDNTYQLLMQHRATEAEQLAAHIQQMRELARAVAEFRASLRLDETLSPLTPEQRLAEARLQFAAAAQAALSSGGQNTDAVNQAMNLGRTLAEIARQMFASGSGYTTEFNYIDSVMAQIQALLANIPVHGAGGYMATPHLAVVGDRPEVIVPIGSSPRWHENQMAQMTRAAGVALPPGGDDRGYGELCYEIREMRRSFDSLADQVAILVGRQPLKWGTNG